MVLVLEQQEAGNAVVATVAAMPLLQLGVGSTLLERSYPCVCCDLLERNDGQQQLK